jgi:hypothetical protein
MAVTGWAIHSLHSNSGWDRLTVYRAVFWGYAVFGVIKLMLAMALSKECEAPPKETPIADPESAPLLGDGAEDEEPKKRSFLPEISSDSRIIVFNLCLLFALDAFASGLAPL